MWRRCQSTCFLIWASAPPHTFIVGTLSPECTQIAHRRSLAISTADKGIAGNSAARTIFTHFLRRRNRGSLAIFFAEEIASWGLKKIARFFWGAVNIAAAAAENSAILAHSAFRPTLLCFKHDGVQNFGPNVLHFVTCLPQTVSWLGLDIDMFCPGLHCSSLWNTLAQPP